MNLVTHIVVFTCAFQYLFDIFVDLKYQAYWYGTQGVDWPLLHITLLPEPWGFFHYGWWTLWHSAILNPILLIILLGYYKWVWKIENKLIMNN